MLSKKNLEYIKMLEHTYDSIVDKEFEKQYKKPTIFEIDQEDSFLCDIKCWDCGFSGKVDSRKYAECPNCGNKMMNSTNHEETFFYVAQEENGFIILDYSFEVTATLDEFSYEKTLSRICVFSDNNMYFFENSGGWTKRNPKSYYAYYSKEVLTNLSNEEDINFRLKFKKIFRNNYYSSRFDKNGIRQHNLFYFILCGYKDAVKNGDIKKPETKKKKESPDIEIPEIKESQLKVKMPDTTKITVQQQGVINIAHCNYCGHDFPVENMYYNNDMVCPCCKRENARGNVGGNAFALFNIEEGDLLCSYEYMYELNQKEAIPNYKFKYIRPLAGIMFTDNGIFFYKQEKDKTEKSTCNEISNFFKTNAYYFYRSSNKEVFVGGEESFIQQMKDSRFGKTGYIELCENLSETVEYRNEPECSKERKIAIMLCGNINYFGIYNNCHAIEQLAKSNMTTFVKDLITRTSCPKFINKKGTTPQAILGITKAQFKEIREANINQKNFEIYKKILSMDPNAAYTDCVRYMNQYSTPDSLFQILEFNIPKINMREIEKYMQGLDDYQCINWSEGLSLWKDYLQMCIALKCDMNDRSVIFTNSLKLEHDRAVRKYNNIKDKIAIKNFEEAVALYKDLEYQNDDYDFMVIVPKSQEELYEEGRVLHHCVGSYARSVAEGRSTILFIRRKDAPDTPLCTVEVSKGRLVQARTKYNNQAYSVPGVKKFMYAWAKEKKIILGTR